MAKAKDLAWLENYRDKEVKDSWATSNKLFENSADKVVRLDQFYSPNEAARMLGVSPKFIYERISSGELKSIKVGRLRRVSRDELETWLTANQSEVSHGKK